MRKTFSKAELKKLAEIYFNVGELFYDPEDKKFTQEQKDTYNSMFSYYLMGNDDKGEFDTTDTYNFLDALSDYQIDQYISLGKESEKVKNDLSIDSNLSAEQKSEQERMRDKYADAVALFNTASGAKIGALPLFIGFFSLYKETDDLTDKLKMTEKNGIFDLYSALLSKKLDEKSNNLSGEDKKYFEMGRELNSRRNEMKPPIAEEFDKCSQEWKEYAEEKRKDIYAAADKTIEKYGIENSFYNNYKDNKQNVLKFANDTETLTKDFEALYNSHSFGHSNSQKYNEIIDAYNSYLKLDIDANKIEFIQQATEEGLRLTKQVEGKINRIEDSLTNYLEDKWKARKSPLGEQRFNKVFEILEKINPEKANDMREFHAMKNSTKVKNTVDFKTYCQNKKAEKECLNFSDVLQEEGMAKDFVVINKSGNNKAKEKSAKGPEK